MIMKTMRATQKKRIFTFLYLIQCVVINLLANNMYLVETQNTVMVFSGKIDGKFLLQYFGSKPGDVLQIEKSGIGLKTEAYPTFGIECTEEKALQATHIDGNLSTDLYLKSVDFTTLENNVTLTKVSLYDNKYPFFVTLYYKAYIKEDVIETWSEISHKEKGNVILTKYASFFMPISTYNPWTTHFHGAWAGEFDIIEEKLERGMKTIKNHEGVRNTLTDNPSVIISFNGQATEEEGELIAGTLAWTGNYKISMDVSQKNRVNLKAGINEEESQLILKKNEVFKTPEFIFTYSDQGKGKASRNIHKWARNYGVMGGDKARMILLNSWEGVKVNITEAKMLSMIDDISALGGELFVMDDGWFGNKYPRMNDKTSLGDWVVDSAKLPNGLQPLVKRATEKGIKFGIWLEPEMMNIKSELFEKHPEWVIQQPNREIGLGRQMTMDLSNPKVQDYIYHVINNLLIENPEIAYIKWDANHHINNVGSEWLPANEQSSLYIEYHKGLQKIFQRIRESHPDLVMQACASGGGRVSYGYLKYFQEFWLSDNTDALRKLYMQWGASHFFPALTMASHVSVSPNLLTGRVIPLKFRVDLSMTGRLGIEMQPKDLNSEEWTFVKKAIENYKTIRPVVQFGDLYRLVSPYDKSDIASLMYVSEKQDHAVLYAFNLSDYLTYRIPALKLKGLDPKKSYKIIEINAETSESTNPLNNKVFKGEFLMDAGIQIVMKKAFQSVIFELIEIQ